MRRLIGTVVVLGVVWCAWWWGISTVMQRGAETWFETRRAEGWQAQHDGIVQTGFPLALRTRVRGIALADAGSGLALTADHIELGVPAYWPGYATLRLPETPVTLGSGAQALILTAAGANATLRLRPGLALQLERLGLLSDAWQVSTPAGLLAQADGLQAVIAQDPALSTRYIVDLRADRLVPGDLLRLPFAVPRDWPRAFEAFEAAASVTFDRPWDRTAFGDRPPQPRGITITQATAEWGPLRVAVTGDLTVDEAGVPEGTLRLEVRDWQQILDLGAANGALTPTAQSQAQLMLGALSNLGGAPGDLDLTLRFERGQMYLGTIQLGPAPRLILG